MFSRKKPNPANLTPLGQELPPNGELWHSLRKSGYIQSELRTLSYSQDLKNLVLSCTDPAPSKRIKASQIKLDFRSPSENERR